MASEAYWFNEGVLTFQEEDTSTDYAPIGLQDVTITPSWEISRLYTADSGFIDTQKQAEHSVSVEIGYSKFDIDAAQQWLGGSGATSTASSDTADPQKFTVKLVGGSADGTFERTLEVTGVTFGEWEMLNGSQGEYEEYSLSGTGEKIGQIEDTTV